MKRATETVLTTEGFGILWKHWRILELRNVYTEERFLVHL